MTTQINDLVVSVPLDVAEGTPTMTTREIAELAGARHNDVITTVDRLFDKGLLRSSRKSRAELTGGRPADVYDLTARDTYVVIAGYSDEVRAKIVDRWMELEAKATKQAPNILDNIDPSRVIYLGPKGDISLAGMYVAAVDAKFIGVQAAAKKYGITAGFLERILNLRSRDLSKLGAQAQTGLGEMIADGLKGQLKLERTPTTALEGKY